MTWSLIDICRPDRAVRIIGHLTGLESGLHGFHIHERPATDLFCANIGGHYNPLEAGRHGGRNDLSPNRHFGDLGNIFVSQNGHAHINMTDLYVNLYGKYSVLNRTLVVTKNADDIGHKGDVGSLSTGNSGPPVACGTIMLDEIITISDDS